MWLENRSNKYLYIQGMSTSISYIEEWTKNTEWMVVSRNAQKKSGTSREN